MKYLSKEKLCTLSVMGHVAGVDIIGSSHAAYYMSGNVEDETVLHQLRKFRDGLAKLRELSPIVDELIDELEGRKPPVKVDEQVAA